MVGYDIVHELPLDLRRGAIADHQTNPRILVRRHCRPRYIKACQHQSGCPRHCRDLGPILVKEAVVNYHLAARTDLEPVVVVPNHPY
jgi:hypothetical protein